jgi:NADPH:quinone reductase-like Zn-dependent oxidoreductase
MDTTYDGGMRAVVYRAFGDPSSVLAVEDREVPEPAPGQVRVKMKRAAIHNHDLWTVRGRYGVRPPLPAMAGSEASGIVDAVGEGVTGVRAGDRVAALAPGTWSELFVTSAAALVPLPDGISDDVGCQLVAMPLSAMALLDTYRVEPPDFIAQNAANGAVGKTLARLAKARGTNVLHLVRSEEAARELAEHGIAGAVSTDAPDWRDRAKAVTNGGRIRCAIDSVGGKASGEICSLLSPGGKLVAFGAMSGEPMQLDPGAFIFKQITLEGFWLSKQNAVPPERSRAMIAELVKLVAEGVLDLPVAGVFPLERVAEAAAASVQAARRGKVLLTS